MTPNVADFIISGGWADGTHLICPMCDHVSHVGWADIRTLIRAASTHARDAHAMSETLARTGA